MSCQLNQRSRERGNNVTALLQTRRGAANEETRSLLCSTDEETRGKRIRGRSTVSGQRSVHRCSQTYEHRSCQDAETEIVGDNVRQAWYSTQPTPYRGRPNVSYAGLVNRSSQLGRCGPPSRVIAIILCLGSLLT